MTNWLTIEEASKHLGIGKTVLYTLARKAKIPANKVGKKWLFEKKKLDGWLRTQIPIESYFTSVNSYIEDNEALREPQREGYFRVYDFFRNGGRNAIVQIPVGCGKSGLAALLPFGLSKGRVLIISPNLTIKEGLFQTFDITDRQRCFWRKTGVLEEADMISGPFACTLDQGNISVCKDSHIIITNIHQLATNVDKWLNQFSDEFFDLIIVDEGHHSPTTSWKNVFKKFPNAKVVNMTATPFRADKKEIEGDRVYRYPFKEASLKGYIKKVQASYIAPAELTFNLKGEIKTYTLDEVLKLKEQDWFSRGVALSEVCNRSIVDNSLEKLEQLRLTGTKHQLIAVACQVNHAKTVRSLYSERGYSAEVIYSELPTEKKQEIIRKLKNGDLDCIVQVQMLGEGFDHPKLSVAAIFRPFRTLSPYLQFVGRILRVVVQNDPIHPDNYGHIVTHAGMNLDQRLREFKEFEKDDQNFWEKVIGGEEPDPPREVINGNARMKLGESIIAEDEIVDHLIEEDFITVEDEHILRDLEKKLEQLGLDPSEAKNILARDKKKADIRKGKAAEPFTVLPQKAWQESKRRLNERVRSAAKTLINRNGLKIGGIELPLKYTSLGVNAANNLSACIIMINNAISKTQSGKRKDWKTDDFKKAMDNLPEILNSLTRKIKKAKSIYEKTKKR